MDLYHAETYLLFCGGLASLLLSVVIIYSRREYKRETKLKDLENSADQEEYGDFGVYLNEEPGFEKLSFWEEMTKWGLQPLYIISFVNLVSSTGKVELAIVFVLTLFVIVHEFWAANKYSSNWMYKISMSVLWIALLLIFSHQNNSTGNIKSNDVKIENIQK